MSAIEVTLTWAELSLAASVGSNRRVRRLRSGGRHRWGHDGADNWSTHIEAAASELATAKMLDRYWSDDPRPDYDGDIGEGIQVRHTHRANGRLILHPEDRDDHVFYLARGTAPAFEIVGFISGERGKSQEFWADPGTGRPAYFIPDEHLIPPTKGITDGR